MKLELFRLTSNHLYTQGKLLVNGGQFSNSVEHTFSMLPIGEYQVKLQKITKSHKKMVIIPVAQACPAPSSSSPQPSIDQGNSWKDALANNSIVIGRHHAAGCVIKSPEAYNLLFNRMKKSKTPITLIITDLHCKEDKPNAHWLK